MVFNPFSVRSSDDESVNSIMYIEAKIPGEGVHSSYPPLQTTYINSFADEGLNQ